MKTLRVLYHMARADFLERTRRYSFLLTLGVVIWLGYAAATGIITLTVPPNYTGEINSAWVGALMTMTAGLFLAWIGFYLVIGSVGRDYDTRVGQILATTPLTRPAYTLGKWLSNFAVLAAMELILMIAGVLMILFIGRVPLEPWALISPLLFLGLPLMALVAAVAVLFDTIPWLRGGLGSALYFFLFLFLFLPSMFVPYSPGLDFTGQRLIGDSIYEAALGTRPTSTSTSFGMGFVNSNPSWFRFDGIQWTAGLLLWRLLFVLAALGLVLLAALFFDRFNTAKPVRAPKRPVKAVPHAPAAEPAAVQPPARLTPFEGSLGLRFGALYLAECKLLVKGRRWWWYLVLMGLLVAQLLVPLRNVPTLLAVAWIWLIVPLNELGNRETQQRTDGMIFSAPRAAFSLLPALWLAAISLLAVTGSGALVRYAMQGRPDQVAAWLSGVLFIPALAAFLGTLTNGRRLFEIVYVVWMYLILNGIRFLDFLGASPGTPWPAYMLASVILLAVAVLLRHLRLTGWRLRARPANS
jgi:hypothetical protein